ncbi:hypothetical protein HDV06_006384 [Boothiomyces sp. JEL0866]|nr:hypothetical protein HDV06_006384 [Boothiomyces sp. JEL0866]
MSKNKQAKNKKSDVQIGGTDQQWVDRVAYEMKAQRQWAQKWQTLTDPKLFNDQEAIKYPQKQKTTKWSTWSVLNPPDRSIIVHNTPPPPQPFFKITGNRDSFLARERYSPERCKQFGERNAPKTVKENKNLTKSYPATSNLEYGWLWQDN